jgi:hypothetical protein
LLAFWLPRYLPAFHPPSHFLRAAATNPWSSTSNLSQMPRRIRSCLECLWTVPHDHARQTRSTTTLHTQRFTKQPSLRPKKQTVTVARIAGGRDQFLFSNDQGNPTQGRLHREKSEGTFLLVGCCRSFCFLMYKSGALPIW